MRLKSFSAKTMTQAMQMVREELGEDAVIVATREEQGGPARGGSVRVTAAIDPAMNDDQDPFARDDAFDHTPFNQDALHDHDDSYDDDIFAPNHAHNTTHPTHTTEGKTMPHHQSAPDSSPVNFETHDRIKSSARNEWLQYDDENDETSIAEEITDTLLRHGVTEEVLDHLLSCATVVGLDNAGTALIAAIEHLFTFQPLPDHGHAKAMMMVGTPGSGKTLGVAKMAARGVMNGLKVGVITCDTVRAGGVEQLQSFTNLLGTPLKTAADDAELKRALNAFDGYDQVLIDTAAINPFDKNDIRPLAKMIGIEGIEPYAIMPGGIDAEEAGESARVFSAIGINAMIPTRIDISRRLGGIITAAHQGHLAFSHGSNTPKVADGFVDISPKSLARLLMPRAFRDNLQKQTTKPLRKARQAS